MTWSLVQCSLLVLLPRLSLRAASLIARLLGRPALPPGFPTPLGSQWGDASAVAVVRTPLEDQWGNAAALVVLLRPCKRARRLLRPCLVGRPRVLRGLRRFWSEQTGPELETAGLDPRIQSPAWVNVC